MGLEERRTPDHWIRHVDAFRESYPGKGSSEVMDLLYRISPSGRMRPLRAELTVEELVHRAVPWIPDPVVRRYIPRSVQRLDGDLLARSLFTSFRSSDFGRDRIPLQGSIEHAKYTVAVSKVSPFLEQLDRLLQSDLRRAFAGDGEVAEDYEASLFGFVMLEAALRVVYHEPLEHTYLDAMVDGYRRGMHILGQDAAGDVLVHVVTW